MQMEELACYLPGNLALGVAEGAVAGEKAVQYAAIAEELTHTCRRMYTLMPAGELWNSCARPYSQILHLHKNSLTLSTPTFDLCAFLFGDKLCNDTRVQKHMLMAGMPSRLLAAAEFDALSFTRVSQVWSLARMQGSRRRRSTFWMREGSRWSQAMWAMCCGRRRWKASITCGG